MTGWPYVLCPLPTPESKRGAAGH